MFNYFDVTNLTILLFAYGQSPLFILCVISKKREKILKYIIPLNLIVSVIFAVNYKFNNGNARDLGLSILAAILFLVYVIFNVIYKKKAVDIFDNDNYKERNIKTYIAHEKEWNGNSKLFSIAAIIYLLVLIIFNKYVNVENFFTIVINEIIIIINYFIWSKCSKQLIKEIESLI